ncbi:unnamed protein product [Caenorhabditis sp. 36 PRJEB53466]|nr:unnamed protein product [Caenorhabditis sp. 36 PRJEB53466]
MSTNLSFFCRRFISNQASALTKRQKFYKEVSVVNETDERGEQFHKILLDHRTLKTQGGQILKVLLLKPQYFGGKRKITSVY